MLLDDVRAGCPHKTLVMGILNITPDSFYEGSRVFDVEAALGRARAMVAAGADMLDVGGESTRPYAEPLTADDECARVLPVIERLGEAGVPVSIDTYHAKTARQALKLGVRMVNDISAFRLDPDLAGVVAGAGCEYVLMHMQGTPGTMQDAPAYGDVIDDICAFFEERMAFAVAQGIKEENIWLDPGFGFGKTVEHNLTILRRLAEFKKLGRPLLVGTSNKGTIGTVLGTPIDDRLEGTAATVAISIWNGADAIRVHDVKAMARVAKMTEAILKDKG